MHPALKWQRPEDTFSIPTADSSFDAVHGKEVRARQGYRIFTYSRDVNGELRSRFPVATALRGAGSELLRHVRRFSPAASPTHTIVGHAIGILCGFGALWACGLTNALPTIEVGVDRARIFAAALSLAATGAVMILLKSEHPPAGATTLIVSLGIVSEPFHLVLIEVAVALLALQAIVINRIAGLHYPVWKKRDD